MAECPANQNGVTQLQTGGTAAVLDDIHNNDWALYAGVEFGAPDYPRTPDSVKIAAFPFTDGVVAEVWLDSLDSGNKIAECAIQTTGSPQSYATYTAAVKPVSGMHDVYVKFVGPATGKLILFQTLSFTAPTGGATPVGKAADALMPRRCGLEQNFPNPFNPTTRITFSMSVKSFASLKIFDVMGREISTLVSEDMAAGTHNRDWNGSAYPSGVYFYRLDAGSYSETKRLTLLK